ncbi:hypothetical protein T440DRAFT_527543 [Plenodomus tracheiphilus IPT5]|uniref:Uncharacterized protein n=1 Tax=Plenodomus tracheiphilus IPT5 TaxID=1408161 RepID=A0A6A7B9H9_9PLEO|nr:hypothetical protein T440DRAFT_527543 [Plenodomus tracheiphilus IPT5]
MNVEKCVALRNEILLYGWTRSDHSLGEFANSCKPWFEYFNDNAKSTRAKLGLDLVKFLEQARFVWVPCGWHSFCYWVWNTSPPEFMFEFEVEDPRDMYKVRDANERPRFVVLYEMNHFANHYMGLVYDQETHLCIKSPTIWETDDMFLEWQVWHPLDVVLEFWLDQIHQGKIDAVPKDGGKYGLEYERMHRFDPWVFVPYSDSLLERNLRIFGRLVDAIESRMPLNNAFKAEEVSYGIIEESILQSINLPQGFAYEFIRCARRPRFSVIAPGLEIPTPATFSEQSSILKEDQDNRQPPIHLFRSKYDFVDTLELGVEHVFGWPYRKLSDFPAGLYLLPTSNSRSEDECCLVLPFAVGYNGYARKTDGSPFETSGTQGTTSDSIIDVYCPGYQPFEEMHE